MKTFSITEELSKPKFLYPLWLRLIGWIMSPIMIVTLVSLVVSSYGEEGWIFIVLIMSIPIGLFGAMLYFPTFTKQRISPEGFSVYRFKEKIIPWSDISKIDALYDQNGMSILILRDSKNKKFELGGSIKNTRPLFEEIKKYILENNYEYTIPEMPVFKHAQWPTKLLKIIQILSIILAFSIIPFINQLTNLPFYYYIIGFFAFVYLWRPILLIQMGFVDCDSSRIIFTNMGKKGRYEWNEILEFTDINKKKTYFLNYFELCFNTRDGQKVIRTTNEETFNEFEKIKQTFNNAVKSI